MLGVSVIPLAVRELWFLALIPVVYIAAIIRISRGEVYGKNRKALFGGSAKYGLFIIALFIVDLTSAIS